MSVIVCKRGSRKGRAVSPVIATVILVAIAITVAVAVAYWMGGIAGQFTKFEKVEIQSAVCTRESDGGGASNLDYWKIVMKLKNTGTATATLIGVFINEEEVSAYGSSKTAITGSNAVTNMTQSYTITSGNTGAVEVYISYDNYKSLTSGTTINIKIHSAGGMDYIKLIELV